MTLSERLDLVLRERGISDTEWSERARLSDRYITVQRQRFKQDPSYRLPERGAAKLAAAVKVSVEWLRFGRGTMDGTIEVGETSPRDELIDYLGLAVGKLRAAGDLDGARKTTAFLASLLESPTTQPELATSPTAPTPVPVPKRATG